MTEFQVDWYVSELVNGDGADLAPRPLAEGHCVKEAVSASEIEIELADVLRSHFPEFAQTGYQDMHRIYEINVKPVGDD